MSASPAPLRFGAFFAPFHPVGQSPTLALEYDLDRVVALDRLGFDEAWFGEHHSGGYEIIGCPEIIPHFRGQLGSPRASHEWATAKRAELFGRAGQAIMNAITTHVDEKKLDAEAAVEEVTS